MVLIGVSVAVPDPAGSDLQRYRIDLGDAHAAGIPTHVTLVPPTEVPGESWDGLVDHLRDAARQHRAFDFHLRGTGTFRPVSPVVFVNVVEGISACELLAKSVRSGLLDLTLDFPYHPHVTVAHDLPDADLDRAFADLAGFESRFVVDRFWLYTYDDVAGWVPQQAFDLTG